jgi:hypothetical protein
MRGSYLVHMPTAEAPHLAGIGPPWPASPEVRCVQAIREWLYGLQRRRFLTVPVRKIVTDLTAVLSLVPAACRPARGPFVPPANGGPPLPGSVEYLGAGIVRLDETAMTALAGLPAGDDFRVIFTNAGPLLSVGADHYLVREERQQLGPT